ncbi:DUF2523 family protein [Pseudoduganella dura]|uniref:DUF2523 family protein n=1 Tax=Pseudoduganella dura TaxID=321982 RepID=UPI0016763C5D|nr:DUF2523 family protein [Pseudoduganella dura]GGY21284.1 membrane protein [Pseudoduganella dura]
MFGILLSALFSIVGWLFRSVLVKFILFFGLFYVSTEFMAYLVPKLPGGSTLTAAFAGLPAGLWFFLDLFQVGLGVKMCLAAYVTRFSIRRIPVIG